MNVTYIHNPNLRKAQRASIVDIDIYELRSNYLKQFGWEYISGWPTRRFEKLISFIRFVNPLLLEDGPKFWDTGLQGYNIYNHAIGEFTQRRGISG